MKGSRKKSTFLIFSLLLFAARCYEYHEESNYLLIPLLRKLDLNLFK